jgi:hypothetical protein
MTAKILRIVLLVLIGWYLILCVGHYFNQRLLWNDEFVLLKSIRSFGLTEIFTVPLLDFQVFPRVYLLAIQTLSKGFGFSLLSLRFLPFVCMTSAFLVWLAVVRKELKLDSSMIAYLLCWAGSINMVYYGAELKQYSMDVLVAGIFTLFLYHQDDLRVRWQKFYFGTLYILPLLLFFSYITIFFLGVIFYNLAIEYWQKRRNVGEIIGYSAVCAAVFAVSYCFDMRFAPKEVYARQGHGAYFIYFDSIGEFFGTLEEGINNLFSRWYAENPRFFRKIARFFAVFGLINIIYVFFKNFKKDGCRICSLNTLGFVLFAEHVVLAMLHKYPLGQPRTSLFFAPFVFYFTVQGICALASLNKHAYRVVMTLFIVFLAVVSLGLARNVFILGDLGAQSFIWR